MKQTSAIIVSAVVLHLLWAGASPGRAQSLAHEGFDYPTNLTLINNTATGYGFTNDWREFVSGNDTAVVTNSLSYTDLNGRGVDVTGNKVQILGGNTGRTMDTNAGGLFGLNGYLDSAGNIGADGETLYASLLFKYVNTNGQYSSPLTLQRDGDADGNMVFQIQTDQQNRLAIYDRVDSIAQLTSGPVDTNTHFIVLKFVFNSGDDSVYGYLDPTNLLAEPTLATASLLGAGDFSFDRISFGDFQGANDPFVDEIRFGGTWSSVIPEPGTWAAMALALLGALGWRARRRS